MHAPGASPADGFSSSVACGRGGTRPAGFPPFRVYRVWESPTPGSIAIADGPLPLFVERVDAARFRCDYGFDEAPERRRAGSAQNLLAGLLELGAGARPCRVSRRLEVPYSDAADLTARVAEAVGAVRADHAELVRRLADAGHLDRIEAERLAPRWTVRVDDRRPEPRAPLPDVDAVGR